MNQLLNITGQPISNLLGAIVIGILFLFLNACGSNSSSYSQDSLIKVEQDIVEKRKQIQIDTFKPTLTSKHPLSFRGKVKSKESISLNFKAGGKITFILDEDVQVGKNKLLAKVDDFDLKNKLSKFNFSLKDIERNLKRLMELQEDSIGSLRDIEQLELKKQLIHTDIKNIEHLLGETSIVAPFAGHISDKKVYQGVYAPPLSPVMIFSSSDKIIEFTTTEKKYSNLALNQKVQLFFNNKKSPITGAISKMSNTPSSNGLYSVEISFPHNRNFLIGQSVEINIPLSSDEKIILLPLKYVNKINPDNSAELYIIEYNEPKKIITPPIEELYNDGIILPKEYLAYTYIKYSEEIKTDI